MVEWFIGKWLDLNGAVASVISLIWYHKPLTVNQRYTSVLVDINIYEYCESEWTDTSTQIVEYYKNAFWILYYKN